MAETVGILGVGVMGSRMGKRLLAAGYPLVVYHYRPEAVAPLVALGAEAASSPAELARRCTRAIVMVRYTSTVEELL